MPANSSLASAGGWARRVGSCSRKPFGKARSKTSLRAVNRLTETVGGELRFRHVPPLLVPLRDLIGEADGDDVSDYVRELIRQYAVNLDEDRRFPLVLQAKEAQASVLEPYLGA